MQARPGIVAADPAVPPLGREIDFIPDVGAAKTFGRRRVGVQILERGTGRER